jgi:hypothetical protein
MGDFNGWSRDSHPCTMDSFGVWTLDLPDKHGLPVVAHDSRQEDSYFGCFIVSSVCFFCVPILLIAALGTSWPSRIATATPWSDAGKRMRRAPLGPQ